MSEPWSPVEIEQRIQAVIERQEEAVADFKQMGLTAAEKRRALKVQESQLLLNARLNPELKTEKMREAWVYSQTSDLDYARDVADHMVATQRKVLDVLASDADLLRTLAAGHRSMTDGWQKRA